jgi:hypothetical protein
MISASVEPPPWTGRRWCIAIAIAYVAQIALMFWLGNRSPITSRKASVAPVFRLVDYRTAELLTPQDPTLFALPHPRGFSGEAWMKAPPLVFHSEDWSEPARFLPPDIQELGAGLRAFTATNAFGSFPAIAIAEPAWSVASRISIAPPQTASRLRVAGSLARRRLLSSAQLPAWTHTDLLTNSIVQLLVDAEGQPVSAVLLRSGAVPTPKQEEANQYALRLARAARFEPIPANAQVNSKSPSAQLSIGTLIFEWQTLLTPPTNAPPAP